MKKIIVAGAGHGGLSAAAILAKNGYDVTVYEKQTPDTIGHDWHDAMDIPAFRFADIPIPPEECFKRGLHMCYYNPKKTVKLNMDEGPGASSSDGITIDRKFLIRYLSDHCKTCGVKFVYGADIRNALTEGTRVIGISAVIDGEEKEIFGDMIIDAAGMYSPLRSNLPDEFGIQKHFSDDDIIEIYRAYYENTDKYITDPNYSVFFFNCGKPGLDWVITEEDYIDVLIGKFGNLSEEEIDTSLNDLRKHYPGMGETPIRGGHTARIPLAKTLPLIVADSYALVGDSAGMTVPLNGSGIDLSLQAGKLLASTIMSSERNGYKKEDLWKYQYRYFTLFGNDLVPISIMRRFFGVLKADDIDFFLEKGILTEKEIAMSGGNFSGINASYIINKLSAAAPKINLLPSLAKTLSDMPKLPFISKSIPIEWDDKKIQNWIEKYSEL